MKYRHIVGIVIVVVLHSVGIVGILRDPQGSFTELTPVNLWVCGAAVIAIHLISQVRDLWRFAVVFMGGFLIECLGVNTGFPFGEYTYHENFGFQLWNTPLVIGMNWLVLSYCAVQLWRSVTKGWLVAVLTGLTLVGLDMLIEIIAPVLRFWSFEKQPVPVENYIAWAILGTCAGFFLNRMKRVSNPASVVLLIVQTLFFLLLVALL